MGFMGLNGQVTVPALEFDRRSASEDIDAVSMLGGSARSSAPQTGVRALMLAVLEDGIRCYFSRIPRIRADAEHWVESGKRSAFSFDVICDLFGIEPDAARTALRRLRCGEKRPRMLRKRHRSIGRRSAMSIAC